MKPNSQRIELSAPTFLNGTYSVSNYSDNMQLVPKKYVDDAVVVGVTPVKIELGTVNLEVTSTPDVVLRNTSGDGDYLVLN